MQISKRDFLLARAVCLVQLGIAGMMALAFGVYVGRPQAYAALFGGLTAVAPTLYFAIRIFVRPADATPQQMVGALFRGEIGKLGLTAVLFWVGVMIFAKQFFALMATYAACLLAYWLVMARVGFDRKQG
ncbi:ATP synthase protein I [Solimonas aquatica]|uniref:ATP synthase protein I n=2 Tax=Solimonas aquatica TaxID=489703 RepID=A0A1H9J979_9GAMM|nr:ATP synthase protein I [Solimonas aquatica]